MKLNAQKYYLLCLLWILAISCSPIKKIPEGKYLINDYKIHLKPKSKNISSGDLSAYLPNTPNRKMLGIWRYKLGFYYAGQRGKNNKFNKWLEKTIGEPPVFYNSSDQHLSADQMTKFLHKKGYFEAQTLTKQKFKKRTASVSYYVQLGKPYNINKIKYFVPDSLLRTYIFSDTSNSLIRTGQIYDEYEIENEASRITNFLRDEGFYFFSRDNVLFEVDSNLQKHKMDIYIRIDNFGQHNAKNPSQVKRVEKLSSERFFINKVIINPDYNPLVTPSSQNDTILFKINQGKKRNKFFLLLFCKKQKV